MVLWAAPGSAAFLALRSWASAGHGPSAARLLGGAHASHAAPARWQRPAASGGLERWGAGELVSGHGGGRGRRSKAKARTRRWMRKDKGHSWKVSSGGRRHASYTCTWRHCQINPFSAKRHAGFCTNLSWQIKLSHVHCLHFPNVKHFVFQTELSKNHVHFTDGRK